MNTIYYNPKCSTCQKTLALLEARDFEISIHEYLEDPLTVEDLDHVCDTLGFEPQQIVRTKEPLFAELGLSLEDNRTRDEWLTLLSENPILIERPIVVIGDRAVIGRPPENVFDLFD
ncbi:MAG: arsenate reductase (glutaredoxin) [Kiritimatiellae bacterium]|nr:arsenate reductase (glutaredoxin) [Kiritimatiellia bacterium]